MTNFKLILGVVFVVVLFISSIKQEVVAQDEPVFKFTLCDYNSAVTAKALRRLYPGGMLGEGVDENGSVVQLYVDTKPSTERKENIGWIMMIRGPTISNFDASNPVTCVLRGGPFWQGNKGISFEGGVVRVESDRTTNRWIMYQDYTRPGTEETASEHLLSGSNWTWRFGDEI